MPIDRLNGNTRFIVTGASGWLGQATLDFLGQLLGDTFASRVYAYGSSSKRLTLRCGHGVFSRPLSELSELPPADYLLFHYAFLGKEKTTSMTTADFAHENTAIGNLVASQAARLGVRGIFLPSSGAVYRTDRTIDTDMEKNPYGVMKARDEERFLKLAKEKNMRLVITRVFNLAGPFINKLDAYALGSILMDIKNGGPIRLHADRPVLRSYVHVMDVVALAFALLLGEKNPSSAAFDTAGDEIIEVGELAKRAAALLGHPEMKIERPAATGEANRYVGDGATMAALMAEYGITPRSIHEQIRDTAAYLMSS